MFTGCIIYPGYCIASCSSGNHSLLNGFILSSQRPISLPHLLHNRIVKCSETLNADFDDNVELVTVWADYMSAINWIYKDGDNKWTATDNGKKWLEKCYNTKDVAYE